MEAAWLILQQEKPNDFVIGTGKMYSVRYFVEQAFRCIDIELIWEGKGIDEIGIDKKTKKKLIQVDPEFYRPIEVDILWADITKAKKLLGWEPSLEINDLIEMMVNYDLKYDEYGYPDYDDAFAVKF